MQTESRRIDTVSPFPDPVLPPDNVEGARQTRLKDALRIALVGIMMRLGIIAVEVWAVWSFGSQVLLVDAIASMFDVLSSIALVLAIRLAAQPPDENHPFGHGRYEPLAGLQLGLLLVGTGGWLAVRDLRLTLQSSDVGVIHPLLWIIPLVAAAILEVAARLVSRRGREHQSAALISEAAHYRIDAITSLLATIAVLVASWSNEFGLTIDRLSGALLAVVMIALGLHAARQNIRQLVDHVPHDEHFDQVRTSALKIEGVHDVEKVRIQHAGPDAHVDIDIEVDPTMTVADAHVITQQVRAQIQADWPYVLEVVVHVEPYYPGDH